MIRAVFLAVPLLVAACNTAQLNVPVTGDAGDAGPCVSAPVFAACDAGAPGDAGGALSCSALPEAGITEVAAYPQGCIATTHHYTPLGDCAIQYICTCSENADSGASYWACQQ